MSAKLARPPTTPPTTAPVEEGAGVGVGVAGAGADVEDGAGLLAVIGRYDRVAVGVGSDEVELTVVVRLKGESYEGSQLLVIVVEKDTTSMGLSAKTEALVDVAYGFTCVVVPLNNHTPCLLEQQIVALFPQQ